MMNRTRLFLTILAFLLIAGCSSFPEKERSSEIYHIRNKGADIPVLIQGNTAAEKMIIYVNGGPGLTAIDIAQADLLGWSAIEEHYAVVYYDQRGTGNSQGFIDSTTITLDQFVDDLAAVAKFTREKYPDKELVVMGHSFGGFLSAKYLAGNDAIDARGLICVDSPFTFRNDTLWGYRWRFLQELALDSVDAGNNTVKWDSVLTWLEDNREITTNDQKYRWRQFIGFGGQGVIPDEIASLQVNQVIRLLFFSHYNIFPAYMSENLYRVSDLLYPTYENEYIFEDLASITIPVHLVWGKVDDLVPYYLGIKSLDYFGTPADSISLSLFEHSSHEPYLSDPERFRMEVLDFVGSL